MKIGVISDTHGSVPDWVNAAFADVDLIVHAGDVGPALVLDLLETIAPVKAVRGNTDRYSELAGLSDHLRLHLDGVAVLVVHDPEDAPPLLRRASADVVVTGHTHRPSDERRGETIYLNPGSPSWPRGDGCSVALLGIDSGRASVQIIRP